MKKQTIEVEGLPEGWKAKEFRLGEVNEPYYDPATKSICRLLLGSTIGVLIVEKIQQRRIVLDQIPMSEARLGDFMRHPGDTRTIINVGAERHDETYTFYREVKENDLSLTNDEPKLILTKKDMLELIEHIKLGGQLNHNVAEFIKDK